MAQQERNQAPLNSSTALTIIMYQVCAMISTPQDVCAMVVCGCWPGHLLRSIVDSVGAIADHEQDWQPYPVDPSLATYDYHRCIALHSNVVWVDGSMIVYYYYPI